MNLEHLDDADPFIPDDTFRAAVRSRGDDLRRRARIRRAALGSGSFVVVIALVIGIAAWRSVGIDRVDVAFSSPPISMDAPFDVLVVGIDTGLPDRSVETGAGNADTIIVVHVDPAARTIRALSIPRDLHPTDAASPTARLAAIHRDGGPEALIEAIGLPVNAYIALDTRAMSELVAAIDGLDLAVPTSIRDTASGLDLGASQCTRLDGEDLVALVRSRHLEVLDGGGSWTTDRSGDAGRRARQLVVLDAIVHQLPRIATRFDSVDGLVDLARTHLTIDSRLGTAGSLGMLLELAGWITDPRGVTITSATLPTEWTDIDGTKLIVTTPADRDAAARWLTDGGTAPSVTTATEPGTPSAIPAIAVCAN